MPFPGLVLGLVLRFGWEGRYCRHWSAGVDYGAHLEVWPFGGLLVSDNVETVLLFPSSDQYPLHEV